MSSPAVPKLSELSVRIANAHQVDLFHAGLAPVRPLPFPFPFPFPHQTLQTCCQGAGAVVREIMVSPTYLNGLGILWSVNLSESISLLIGM